MKHILGIVFLFLSCQIQAEQKFEEYFVFAEIVDVEMHLHLSYCSRKGYITYRIRETPNVIISCNIGKYNLRHIGKTVTLERGKI